MKIQEFIQYPNNEKVYNIYIKEKENLNAEEISRCFLEQYPDTKGVIAFSGDNYTFGLIVLGIKIEKNKK